MSRRKNPPPVEVLNPPVEVLNPPVERPDLPVVPGRVTVPHLRDPVPPVQDLRDPVPLDLHLPKRQHQHRSRRQIRFLHRLRLRLRAKDNCYVVSCVLMIAILAPVCIVPIIYDYIYDLSDGRAKVTKNGESFYIDKYGNRLD